MAAGKIINNFYIQMVGIKLHFQIVVVQKELNKVLLFFLSLFFPDTGH